MPNDILITLVANPVPYDRMSFKVLLIGDSYLKNIYKIFVPNPLAANEVNIGATLEDTILALFNSLLAHDTDASVIFSLSGNIITLNFTQQGSYYPVRNLEISHADYVLELLEIEEEIEPEIPSFSFETFAITITDTYDNFRVLLEEYTQISSPTLKWDAGDALYEPIMASELSFNMMVNDNTDAKFKHLFTGDENRYLVKLLFVNQEEDSILAWQGFLLPDQFTEPYKNGVNFIEFIATDMIGSLKGKYLQPWFYVQRLPIAELIATILKLTGLEQELLVKPSILPQAAFMQWRDINVNLEPYFDGNKYTDVYQILIDILEAQALTIYSYKGFWWLDGLTRKKDTDGELLSFDVNGKQKTGVFLFEKEVVAAVFERNVPVLTGVTPWKAVEIDFNAKTDNNTFSDSVVQKEIFLTVHTDSMETAPLTGNAYRDTLLKEWLKVGCPELIYRPENIRRYKESFNFQKNVSGFLIHTIDVNYTLVNYFQCPEMPLLLAGIEYEIEIEALFIYRSVYNVDGVASRLKAGKFDSLFRFQMLQNNVTVLTNVPELGNINKFRYERSNEFVNNDDRLTFKIKAKFILNNSGPIVFRILHPKVENANDFSYLAVPQVWDWKTLKINVIDEIESEKPLLASRDVNYTQIYKADIGISASENVAVENSFGLGFPINFPPYLYSIQTAVLPEIYDDQQYFPTEIATLKLQTFSSNVFIRESLFIKDFRRAVFKQSLSGKKELFKNLWVRTKNGVVRMGYLISYTGKPLLPKSFRKIQLMNPGDFLQYMEVIYPTEDFSKRKDWYIYDDLVLPNLSYSKVLAKAIHAVQPTAMYRLEGTLLDLIFPDMLIDFYFDDENREFIPTTLTLNLSTGKTQIVATEKKFTIPNDLYYE